MKKRKLLNRPIPRMIIVLFAFILIFIGLYSLLFVKNAFITKSIIAISFGVFLIWYDLGLTKKFKKEKEKFNKDNQ